MTVTPTWPDGTPMHDLQRRLLRLFDQIPEGHWMTQPERDALLTLVKGLLRQYYDEQPKQEGEAL